MEVSNIKPGFKYMAWVGYEWIEVEYPHTGFDKEQLTELINSNSKIIKPTQP